MSVRAASTPTGMRLLKASAVPVSTTGDLNENTLATVTIPAGAMGLNGGVLIYTTWSYTNSANNKIPRIRFGGAAGTQYLNPTLTATNSAGSITKIRNRGAANSQVGLMAPSSSFGVGASSAVATSSVDTTAAVDLVFSGQLALGTETITLESYEVWLLP